jgi:3-oxoacyl-[acyl-carrier protein] reductase
MRILVTGGASGLGAAITRRLAADPKNEIWLTYCRSEDAAKALAVELKNVKPVRCDFTRTEDVEELCQKLPGMEIEGLVNNAVTGYRMIHFHKQEAKDFTSGFAHNVMPAIRITQAALQGFRKRRFGRIVTILTSYLINRPPTGLSSYVAEKAYLLSLSKSWAAENAAFNVTANCLSPSFMKTGLTRDVDPRQIDDIIAHSPLGRLITPQEVAESVASVLFGPAEVNGANLVINGDGDVV